MTTTTPSPEAVILTRQRRDGILAQLREHGAVRTGELCRRWTVSAMTVRRDLAVLEADGFAVRVHGGAVSATAPAGASGAAAATAAGGAAAADAASAVVSAARAELRPVGAAGSTLRREAGDRVGHAIAGVAARLVQPGAAIGLSGGRVVEAMAAQLVHQADLTVVTNSVRVAAILSRAADDSAMDSPTVVLTGGHRGPGGLLVGPLAVAALRTMRVDLAFVDCAGADPAGGLTVGDIADAELRARLLRSSGRRVLLAEPSVFGARALAPFAALNEIDTVITPQADQAPPPPGCARAAVLRAVGEVLAA